MTAEGIALSTLRERRVDVVASRDAATRSHSYLVVECNRKLEESASAVGRLTEDLNDLDLAIETLGGAA